jgi:hypothetical protein
MQKQQATGELIHLYQRAFAFIGGFNSPGVLFPFRPFRVFRG